MAWPIFKPSSQSKPLDKIVNLAARGGFYQAANTAALTDLLAALADAGSPVPSTAAPVYADLVDSGTQMRNVGSGWFPMSPLTVVATDAIDVAALPATYRDGGLTEAYFSTSGPGGAWPARPSHVLTIRNGNAVAQYCMSHSVTSPKAFYRSGSASSQTWSDWIGLASPYAEYYGEFTVAPLVQATSKDTTVTFPSGRFTQTPILTGIICSTRYGNQIMTKSPTSATLRMTNYSGADAASSQICNYGFVQASLASGVGIVVLEDLPGASVITVICPTVGCENEGIPIEINVGFIDPDTGLPATTDEIVCGGCGAILTGSSPAARRRALRKKKTTKAVRK
jgi:hypothetical protein